jgi:signal transduction histidine kinase
LVPALVDMSQLIRECCQRHEQLVVATGGSLDVQGPPTVPGSWDAQAVEQVLDNLISNALRYGDGKPIVVRLDAAPTDVEIHVIDHGIGIAQQDRERIFEQFERAITRGGTGGFGIGLWLANQLVRAQGGTIEVWSELGKGSRFTVRLPRGGEWETGAQ